MSGKEASVVSLLWPTRTHQPVSEAIDTGWVVGFQFMYLFVGGRRLLVKYKSNRIKTSVSRMWFPDLKLVSVHVNASLAMFLT